MLHNIILAFAIKSCVISFLKAFAVTPVDGTLYVFKPTSGGPCNDAREFAGKHFARPEIEEDEVPPQYYYGTCEFL